ncbi:Hypothetical protein SMAX5B_001367 [Scophthalmus maximus]|uniref:Uncharacterized protein n=1 Tax=Scophthalmus maximus TaxID=52904 RepID=A0A2U9BA36_SCOMX|nr:Hypothetical protein SMAX5B_001367 [Scophthalmus maximus]
MPTTHGFPGKKPTVISCDQRVTLHCKPSNLNMQEEAASGLEREELPAPSPNTGVKLWFVTESHKDSSSNKNNCMTWIRPSRVPESL